MNHGILFWLTFQSSALTPFCRLILSDPQKLLGQLFILFYLILDLRLYSLILVVFRVFLLKMRSLFGSILIRVYLEIGQSIHYTL